MISDAELNAKLESVMPYIQKCANTFSAAYEVDREDLVQVGMIAAADCARRFEPERGHKFFQFASGNIYWLTQREARRIAPMVKVPRGCSRRLNHTRGSLDGLLYDSSEGGFFNGGSYRLDAILCDEVTPADHADRGDVRAMLNAALAKLSPRVARCVMEHLVHGRPLREIAVDLGCSAERVRQLVNDGLRALRYDKGVKALHQGGKQACASSPAPLSGLVP